MNEVEEIKYNITNKRLYVTLKNGEEIELSLRDSINISYSLLDCLGMKYTLLDKVEEKIEELGE